MNLTDVIPGLETIAPDLSQEDGLRLMYTVADGYAYSSPKLMLLVDLDYLWSRGFVLYPSVKGHETAHRIAIALWESASHAGNGLDVALAASMVRVIEAQGGTVAR